MLTNPLCTFPCFVLHKETLNLQSESLFPAWIDAYSFNKTESALLYDGKWLTQDSSVLNKFLKVLKPQIQNATVVELQGSYQDRERVGGGK